MVYLAIPSLSHILESPFPLGAKSSPRWYTDCSYGAAYLLSRRTGWARQAFPGCNLRQHLLRRLVMLPVACASLSCIRGTLQTERCY